MLMILINILLLIVGCFMETNAAIIILAPIFLPIVESMGINPVHFGIVMVVNLAIGFVTPPLGVNLFVAIGVSDKLKGIKDTTRVTIETISKAVWPMIIACVITLMIVTYVPFFSTVFLGAAA